MSDCAVASCSKFTGLHRRANGRSDGLLQDSESVQNFGLPFGGSPAVTAHCGDYEWLGTACFYCVNDAGQHLDESPDPAAARSDRDSIPMIDLFEETGPI